jgi:hypothetical protein
MSKRKTPQGDPGKVPRPPDPSEPETLSDSAIRERILVRAKTLTQEIVPRLTVAVANLEGGHHVEALAVFYDIESHIRQIRNILSFLEEE